MTVLGSSTVYEKYSKILAPSRSRPSRDSTCHFFSVLQTLVFYAISRLVNSSREYREYLTILADELETGEYCAMLAVLEIRVPYSRRHTRQNRVPSSTEYRTVLAILAHSPHSLAACGSRTIHTLKCAGTHSMRSSTSWPPRHCACDAYYVSYVYTL